MPRPCRLSSYIHLPLVLSEQTNSVIETQKRLKELQAEYERVHHELRETVSEAGTMSKKLRNILVYYK